MKAVFYPDLPKLDPHSLKDETWVVAEPWFSQLTEGKAVLVRRGFVTDGASIPRAFWRLIGHPMMKWLLPHALPHDALYAAELMSRKECDGFLLMSMKLAGVPWWKRNAIWSAVRIGGGAVWRRHTEKSVKEARGLSILMESTDYLCAKHVIEAEEKR